MFKIYYIPLLHFKKYIVLFTNKHQNVEHRSVRVKLKRTYHSSISNARRSLCWLPARKLAEYTLLCITLRAIYLYQPRYLSNFLREYSTQAQRSTSENIPYILRSNSTLVDRSFSDAAPRLLNSLPLKLRCLSNVSSFKKAVNVFF